MLRYALTSCSPVSRMAHKQVLFRSAAREKILRGATQLGRRRARHLGPEIEIGADPEEMGHADRLQRRRDHRQGIRSQGPRGESRRPDAAPGGRKDRRQRSATAPAPRRSWRTRSLPTACATSSPAPARSTSSAASIAPPRPRSRRCARCRARSRPARKRPRSPRSPRTTIRRSASSSPTPWKRSAAKASSRSRNPRPPRPTLEVVEGMQFDRGFISPYFITNAEKMEAVLEDPFVLLCDRKISALKPI